MNALILVFFVGLLFNIPYKSPDIARQNNGKYNTNSPPLNIDNVHNPFAPDLLSTGRAIEFIELNPAKTLKNDDKTIKKENKIPIYDW